MVERRRRPFQGAVGKAEADVVLPPPRTRMCLRCARKFLSAGPGERICPHCKGARSWRDGKPLTGTKSAEADAARRLAGGFKP